MDKLYICDKEASCIKKYKSKKSLSRHVKCKHQIRQGPSTPLPSDTSTTPLLSDTSTTSESSARAKSSAINHNSEIENQRQMNDEYITIDEYSAEPERTLSVSPYTSSNELKKNRFHSIINDFFAYWHDEKVETQMIEAVAIMLIKHSRIAKQNDENYLAVTSAYFDSMYDTYSLHQQTLCNLMNNFIANAQQGKRDGLFDWNCLVIAFTMAHNLLMKYPHLYPDIVDMLLEVFNLAGDDLTKLGGWDNFSEYSKQYYS